MPLYGVACDEEMQVSYLQSTKLHMETTVGGVHHKINTFIEREER